MRRPVAGIWREKERKNVVPFLSGLLDLFSSFYLNYMFVLPFLDEPGFIIIQSSVKGLHDYVSENLHVMRQIGGHFFFQPSLIAPLLFCMAFFWNRCRFSSFPAAAVQQMQGDMELGGNKNWKYRLEKSTLICVFDVTTLCKQVLHRIIILFTSFRILLVLPGYLILFFLLPPYECLEPSDPSSYSVMSCRA